MERNIASLADYQHTYTSSADLLVFDVSLYYSRYQEAARKLGHDEAHRITRLSLINDGVGLITEKISSEKEDNKFVFDTESRVRLQLTPPRHTYIQALHSEIGEMYMTAPEYLFLEKDVLETFSTWRRGLDRKAMSMVKDQFLVDDDIENVSIVKSDDQDDPGGVETVFWGSLKAEEWEE